MVDHMDSLPALVSMVIDSAVATITTVGVPFTAFVVVEKDGERGLHRFMTQRLEDSVELAQQFARTRPDADLIAVALDGYVPFEGKRWDAIVVTAWVESTQQGTKVAQRYKKSGVFKKTVSAVGNPVLMA